MGAFDFRLSRKPGETADAELRTTAPRDPPAAPGDSTLPSRDP